MNRWPRKAFDRLVPWVVAVLAAAPLAAADISLFGDLTFADSDRPDDPSTFVLGALDVYVTQEISERMTGFVELVFEADDKGEFEADVERLWVRYEVASVFQIAAGRFHIPIGYWNRNYHHGTLIQDTVARPFFLAFEDHHGVLPMHIIGLMATGEAWAGAGTLRYEVVVGNGQSLDSEAGLDPALADRPKLDPTNVGDLNEDKSVGARLSLRSDRGWQVAGFGLTQAIAESGSLDRGALVATGETLVEQTILGLDARYEAKRFGFLGEYFDIANDGPAGAHDATAFYVQTWLDPSEKWRLVYRFSSLDTDALDPYFRILAMPEQDHHVLTLGYRTDEVSVVRLEVDRLVGSPVLADATTIRAQWAFLIP